jgi:hypothetical protein
VSERAPRLYVISPEPSEEARRAIEEALALVADEDEAPLPWAVSARREAIGDGLG